MQTNPKYGTKRAMPRWPLLGLPVALALVSGCFLTADPGTGDTGQQLTALPCDVAQALSACQACHGPTLAGGAPFTLVSLGDLTATSPTYSDQTVAQRAVARMGDPNIPMPPHPLDSAAQADIDTIQAWINANYPPGACTPPAGGVNPFATPTACTNGQSPVTYGSQLMYPGRACISCHASSYGPSMTIAGTVYPTAHESDSCVGSNVAGASIVITDANGKTVTVTPNSAGNFYSRSSTITPPYTVKLTYQGRERDMTGLTTAPTNGDCNSCHTVDGANGAPGRIMLP
jgi:hypothetical protein